MKLKRLWYRIKYRKQLKQGYGLLMDYPTKVFTINAKDFMIPTTKSSSKIKIHKIK